MQQCMQQPPDLNAPDLEQRKRDRYRRVDEGVRDGFLAKGSFGKVYITEDTTTGEVVGQGAKRSSGPRAYNGRAQLAGSSDGPEGPVSAPAPCKAHLR